LLVGMLLLEAIQIFMIIPKIEISNILNLPTDELWNNSLFTKTPCRNVCEGGLDWNRRKEIRDQLPTTTQLIQIWKLRN